MSTLAIVPARGGSQRIPRKNIRPFAGRPMLAWPIAAARESGCFDEIMVSTEDAEIAEVACAAGATVPFFRSAENANDTATLADVLLEVLDAYAAAGRVVETFCCLLATAPFVTPERLREGRALLDGSTAGSVVPVCRFASPIQRALRRTPEGRLVMFAPENYATRSQDLEPAFHDAGQFYWVRTAALRAERRLFTSDTLALELPASEVQDIDTEEDWRVAEFKFALRGRRP